MKEEIKLSKEAKIIILDRAIGNVIELFLSTFLATYFYKITQDNLVYLSIYHIISWTVATLGAFIFSDYIKRKNKVNLYRIGTFIKAFYVLLIIILKEKIINYVWLIGLFYGISVATTGFPFNMIESELVKEKERSKYLGYKSAIGEITKVIIPIVLGAYITFTSYQIAAVLILIFAIIKFIISFFIENKNVTNERVNLKLFREEVKKHPQYPIKKLYAIEFFKGITVHGVLSIIVSLLIIYEFNTELNLGIWKSIFSICMIISMSLFAKHYNKNKPNKLLNICFITVIISFICMFVSINKVTIILYNFIYCIFIEMLLAITEIRLFDYSNKPPFDEKLNTEYFIFREIILNIGRILGYSILLFIGLTHNMEYLKILFLCVTIALCIIIIMSKQLSKYENEVRRV